MKTKLFSKIAMVAFVLFFNTQMNSQSFCFINNTACTVVLNYEVRDAACGVCDFNTVTLPASTSSCIQLCDPYDICIALISVGGIAPAIGADHYHNSGCHPSITQGTDFSCGGWTATLNPGVDWIIQ